MMPLEERRDLQFIIRNNRWRSSSRLKINWSHLSPRCFHVNQRWRGHPGYEVLPDLRIEVTDNFLHLHNEPLLTAKLPR